MVHIEKGKEIDGVPPMVVCSETGDYNEEDLIRCALKTDPNNPYVAFQAQYIAGLE
jgi:hypothetical protein